LVFKLCRKLIAFPPQVFKLNGQLLFSSIIFNTCHLLITLCSVNELLLFDGK